MKKKNAAFIVSFRAEARGWGFDMQKSGIREMLADKKGEFQFLGVGAVAIIVIAAGAYVGFKLLMAKLSGSKKFRVSNQKMTKGFRR